MKQENGGYLHGLFEKEKIGASFSVCSLNVWFEELWLPQRYEEQLKCFQSLNADVICLQEVTANYLALLLRDKHFQKRYWISTLAMSNYGCLILSKLPVLQMQEVELPTRMGRSLLMIETEYGSFCTVHLESLDSQSIRKIQLQNISQHTRKHADLFFCGDFNFSGDDPEAEESKCVPSDLLDEMPKEYTLGVNYPSSKYKPGRFDRLLYRSDRFKMIDSCVFGKNRLDIPSHNIKSKVSDVVSACFALSLV